MMQHIYILSCETNGGVFHYSFNKGELKFIDKTKLDRPMYAIIRENKLYVILREIDTITHFGGILSYDINENGTLINPTRIESTNGIVPCHLEVVDNNKYVVNYISGNIVKIGDKTIVHTGNSIHLTRQESPHTHFIKNIPGSENLICCDLGIDKVFVYNKNLEKINEVDVEKGSGPRHLVFSDNGKYCFIANELSSTVSVFSYDNNKFKYIKTISCFFDKEIKDSTCAAIRTYSNKVFVSNRGDDSISAFSNNNGILKLESVNSCFGKSPRDFIVIEDFFIVANELSNSVTILDKNFGLHSSLDNIYSPLCICALEM